MGRRGKDAVEPRVLQVFARRDERRTVQLLRVQVVFDSLWRVDRLWQRARPGCVSKIEALLARGSDLHGLGTKAVAKPNLVHVGVLHRRRSRESRLASGPE